MLLRGIKKNAADANTRRVDIEVVACLELDRERLRAGMPLQRVLHNRQRRLVRLPDCECYVIIRMRSSQAAPQYHIPASQLRVIRGHRVDIIARRVTGAEIVEMNITRYAIAVGPDFTEQHQGRGVGGKEEISGELSAGRMHQARRTDIVAADGIADI